MTAVISPEHGSLYARHLEGLAQSIPEAERLVLPAHRVAEVVAQSPYHSSTTGTLCRRAECANATRRPAELAHYGARPPVSYSRSSAAINIDESHLPSPLRVRPA